MYWQGLELVWSSCFYRITDSLYFFVILYLEHVYCFPFITYLNSLRTSHIFCRWPSGFICEGYGREYRERLLGRWGIVDVNDCCSCAKFLVIASYFLKVSSFLWMGWANIPQFVVICVFNISGQWRKGRWRKIVHCWGLCWWIHNISCSRFQRNI